MPRTVKKPTVRVADLRRDPFDRQKRINGWNQPLLSDANVLIVGCGALGNETAKNLAQTGIGSLTLVDFDSIELTNLNRCILFNQEHVGSKKADVLSAQIRRQFPGTKTAPRIETCEATPIEIYESANIVVTCLDNIDARLTVNRACAFTKTALVDAGTGGMEGRIQTVLPPDTACLECRWGALSKELTTRRFKCGTPQELITPTQPAAPTTTSVVAGIQSNEVIKLIMNPPSDAEGDGGFEFLTDKMMTLNLVTMETALLTLEVNPACDWHDDTFGSLAEITGTD